MRIILLLFLSSCFLKAESPGSLPATCYLFSYFVDNGEDGLHLAWSRAGLKWEALREGRSFLRSRIEDHLMRDPCLMLGPDGIFRLVWTDAWTSRSIGYASSRDLLHWSRPEELGVMAGEPKARNAWAPEIHYDASQRDYLIFWSSTVPGKFSATDGTSEDGYNHRIYMTRTRDFVHYTPTRLFFDPGFSCIDATILPALGRFYLIFKNETVRPVAEKNLWLATSKKMDGPYGKPMGPIATVPAAWVEGPTAIQIGDRYLIYYDCYTQGHFGAIGSRDLKTWTDLTPKLSMPEGIRHGTVLAVPGAVVAGLLDKE